MVVGRSKFTETVAYLKRFDKLSVDTETTGLRPYHDSRIFSLIIAVGIPGTTTVETFYFNYLPYEDCPTDQTLPRSSLAALQEELFRGEDKTWYIHNAKFDLGMFHAHGLEIKGQVHCTKAMALLEHNEHWDYSLEACAERIGFKKDDAVEKYIEANKLTEKRQGATAQYTHKFFDRVPYGIIVPYGERDAEVGYRLGRHQEAAIERLTSERPQKNLPTLRAVYENEKRLTSTLARMRNRGVKIDRAYCVRASRYEADRLDKARAGFKTETGREFSDHFTNLAVVFESDKERWEYGDPTPTGQVNPSFNSDSLKRFLNPAAALVLSARDAKSKRDFYNGFLYHADRDDIVHPEISQDGAGHGRTSSSNPNFQNLKRVEDDEEDEEFLVRRAVIPRPGFIFFMPDWDQMEYRMMFDVACEIAGYESEVVKAINAGKDPHQATADVVTAMGTELKRGRAKNGNFAWLYGSGDQTLAETIGSTLNEAMILRRQLRAAAPEVQDFVDFIRSAARAKPYIVNWFGRLCWFPKKQFNYCAPNYYISGGSADVAKIVMNKIDERCLTLRSKLVLMIHDELPMEIAEEDLATLPREVVHMMEHTYPHKYLPLTASPEWSDKSLADKKKGYPV